MAVVITVLVVLFVPGKAAVPAGTAQTPAPSVSAAVVQPVVTATEDLRQVSLESAIPTTAPDPEPIPTTQEDVLPTPSPTPKPTPEPTPKPTNKPKPTEKPTPTPEPAPQIDWDAVLDYYVVKEGPYYEEGSFSSNHYSYTADELNILAQIIQTEAGGEPMAGKIAVGNVVINSVLCGRWGSTIADVVGRFAYHSDTVPKQEAIDAAHYVLDDEIWKVPQNTYFFKTSGGDWRSYTFSLQIGNHYFYTEDFGNRYNGDSIPQEMYERTYKYAQYGCKPENRVKRIQTMLKELGYDVNTDKVFGETTRDALKQFQKDVGLDADGVAGPTTIKKLIKKYGVEKYIDKYVKED